MSASNRLLDTALRIIAISIAISLAVLLVPLALAELSKSPEERAYRAERAQQETEEARDFALLCSSIDPGEQTPTARRCAAARDQADLEAQRGMQTAANLQVGLTLVGVFLLGWTLYYTRRAVEEAGDATKAASRGARAAVRANQAFKVAAHRELRAYVAVESVTGVANPGTPKAGMITLTLKVKMRNCGQTPAKSVRRMMRVFGRPRHGLGHKANSDPESAIGLSGFSKPQVDIAPGQTFTHEYEFPVRYNPQVLFQPGVKLEGQVDFSDFDGQRWRVPYQCISKGFRTHFANATIEFYEVAQFEEQHIAPAKKQ